MTGQPGNIDSGRDAAADTESRDGRNWQKAVDSVQDARPDARPGRAAGATREVPPPRQSRQPRSARSPFSDLSGEIQRWLVRSSARNMRRELTDLGEQFRRTLGGQPSAQPGDVWDVATKQPSPELPAEAPECAWCPVCRAARQIRKSGPGLGGQLAGAGDAVAAAVQEALSAFDSVLRSGSQPAGGFPADRFPADRFPADRFPTAGAPGEGADHEPDDRD
jgi:hypothetical protein